MTTVSAGFAFTAVAAAGVGAFLARVGLIPGWRPRALLRRHEFGTLIIVGLMVPAGVAGAIVAVWLHQPDAVRLGLFCGGSFLLLAACCALVLSEPGSGGGPPGSGGDDEPLLWPDFDDDYERWFGGRDVPLGCRTDR